MKKLTCYGIALSLLIAATGSLAEKRGHGGNHGEDRGGNHGKHHYKQKGHHYGHRDDRHYGRHYGHRYGHRYGHYKPYRQPRYYRGYYRPDYPSYLGAALFGSAITYSLLHTHNGAHCNDNHGGDYYRQSNRSTEVVGCHRIERLPDGSEVRVEVPMSQCL